MATENERAKLEEKIIKKGFQDFRKELQEASKPMLAVLNKYGIRSGNELLKKITLYFPYEGINQSTFSNYAVNIPNDKELETLENKILENFMCELKELKSRVDSLDFQ